VRYLRIFLYCAGMWAMAFIIAFVVSGYTESDKIYLAKVVMQIQATVIIIALTFLKRKLALFLWLIPVIIALFSGYIGIFILASLHVYFIYKIEELRVVASMNRRLIDAAGKGDIATIREILKNPGVNVDAADEEGGTSLIIACMHGYLDVARLLLEMGADINIMDDPGWTPLMISCSQGHRQLVEFLLDRGVDIMQKDYDGKTSQDWAREKGHKEIERMLQSARSKLLHKKKTSAQSTVKFKRKRIKLQKKETERVFREAAKAGDFETVINTLDCGASVDSRYGDGGTALIVSCQNGNREMAAFLIERGADINARDRYGWTSLMIASHQGHSEVVDMLLAGGADFRGNLISGKTALDFAMDQNNGEVVALFKRYSGDSEYRV